MDGFIKLHRKLLESDVFQNEKLLKVWVWCLLKARYTAGPVRIGHQTVDLQPGEFITGRFKAAEELGLAPSTAWRHLQALTDAKMLDIKTNNKFSVVTVANWALYQLEEQKVDSKVNNKWTTNEQQMDTNKKDKKEKKEKKDKTFAYSDDFLSFWSAYPRTVDKGRAYKCWLTTLDGGAAVGDLILAATNYARANTKTPLDKIKHPSTFLGPTAPWQDWVKPQEDNRKKERLGGGQDVDDKYRLLHWGNFD